jgi:molybdopterin molybdotransferase
MISIEEALHIVHNQKINLRKTEVLLANSLCYYLAETIVSPIDLPSFDNSAMDGYAVCGEYDSYQIIGEVAAGDSDYYELNSGEAFRIFTGSRVPENTTAVIMQERTHLDDGKVFINDSVTAGKNIRLKGGELKKGQKVFETGHKITPATIGMIGALGIDRFRVFKKPIVKLIATGNELIAPGETRRDGQIYESNSHALTGALEYFHFSCIEKEQVRDDYDDIKTSIKKYLDSSDVLILSGGISVGEYDFVKQALHENGVEELFYKVYQKPGKPLFFGRKKDTFVFALPGNPASALTCFYLYVLPFLQKLSGARETGLQRLSIPLAHSYENNPDRPVFLKARVEDQRVAILNRQGSSMIHSMAVGNALVYLKGPGHHREGDLVECILT